MSINRQTEVFYGVLVAKHDNNPIIQEPNSYVLNSELHEKFGNNEFVADGVMRWMCGDYDRNNLYLIVYQDGFGSKILDEGDARYLGPSLPPYVSDGWNALLKAACAKLELTPLSSYGWFVVSDVS